MKAKKNLTIGSLGVGYNEGSFNTTWIKLVKDRLVGLMRSFNKLR